MIVDKQIEKFIHLVEADELNELLDALTSGTIELYALRELVLRYNLWGTYFKREGVLMTKYAKNNDFVF